MTGISLLDLSPICSAFGLDSASRLALVDAGELLSRHVPSFPPDAPALVLGIGPEMFPAIQTVLASVYPPAHTIQVAFGSDPHALTVKDLLLETLARFAATEPTIAIYLPPLPVGTSFEAFQEIIAHLRAPDGCPWDREQTHLTLRKHLLEESYETLSAMDGEDADQMREEFGDLLLQIVLNAQIGSEYGGFTMTAILKGIYNKIIRRHPHVFGEEKVAGVGDVLSNWEKLKAKERKENGETQKGMLDGLPAALPALNQAQEYQDRAARVGFDWPEVGGVLEKIREEIEEVRSARSQDELNDELGDLFFALVNLARWKKVDAESALRGASLKFKRRFGYIEQRVRESRRSMQEVSLDEMEALWDEAKAQEKRKSAG